MQATDRVQTFPARDGQKLHVWSLKGVKGRAPQSIFEISYSGLQWCVVLFVLVRGIPHICHGHKDGVRGEKICHVEKFQISVHEG